jgi:hypothetical protein
MTIIFLVVGVAFAQQDMFVLMCVGDGAALAEGEETMKARLEGLGMVVDANPASAPVSFKLEQNYPNPFNLVTTISYDLAETADVSLTVFNTRGEQVASLVNGRQTSGVHHVSFDASDLSSGIYLYKLQANDHVLTRKMVLAR